MFFDKLYEKSLNVWGEEEDFIIRKGIIHFKGTNILDLGVGDGRNSVYLLKNFFNITGVDISQIGLNNIEQKIKDLKNIGIFIPICSDLTHYIIDKNYSNIICSYVLHFLTRENALNLVKQMKNNTEKGGVNILSGFINKGDLDISKNNGIFGEQEIYELYSDWDIIFYNEVEEEVSERKQNGDRKVNFSYHIMAKKR